MGMTSSSGSKVDVCGAYNGLVSDLLSLLDTFLTGVSLPFLIFGLPLLLAFIMVPLFKVANWFLEQELKKQQRQASRAKPQNIKFKPKKYKDLN